MNGWILLHKKIWDNDLFLGNPYALTIWIWLLTHCKDDGVVTCGRNQIAKDTGIKPPTVQYWLKRFLSENYQLTIIKTNNKCSTFSISKWQEYQRKTISTSSGKLSANYQRPITNKEIKNKEKEEYIERAKNKLNLTKKELEKLQINFPRKRVKQEYEKAIDWLSSTGKTYKDYPAFFRNWLRRSEDCKYEIVEKEVIKVDSKTLDLIKSGKETLWN